MAHWERMVSLLDSSDVFNQLARNQTYDLNGNLTSDGTATYSYDSENRLLGTQQTAHSTQNTYDPFGRRISKSVDGIATFYLYDADQVIAETDAAGILKKKHVYGPGIDEILRTTDYGLSTDYFYHADGLGSIVALTDASGAVVERYAYDVYGKPSITDGVGNVLPQSAFGNRFLFTGREYDTETGLYFHRARYTDPKLGRFLQRDPSPSDLNLYRYTLDLLRNWFFKHTVRRSLSTENLLRNKSIQ